VFILFLPNLVWNIQHHFPFVELQENIRRNGRDTPLSFLAFFGQEILAMNPLNLPLWLGGYGSSLFRSRGNGSGRWDGRGFSRRA